MELFDIELFLHVYVYKQKIVLKEMTNCVWIKKNVLMLNWIVWN